MALIPFVGFVGPSYTLRSVNVDCQICRNLFPEVNEIGSGANQEIAALVGRPGLDLLIGGTAGHPCRGGYTGSDKIGYMVKGNTLSFIDPSTLITDFSEGLVGYIGTSIGRVSMADNGTKLVLVDGNKGYTVSMPPSSGAVVVAPNPATATDAAGGTSAWTNPNNIFTSNDVYATNTVLALSSSNKLDATNYGFVLPATAVVAGIKVEVEALLDRALTCSVQLLKAGVATGTAQSLAALELEGVLTFGSRAELWGTTWTPAEINAATFGAELVLTNSSGASKNASVDYVRVTVYYNVPTVGEPAEITDADFPDGATDVAFLDNYFIVNQAGTNKFFISALNDPTSWDALDFSSKEGKQDKLLTLRAAFRELFLFGDMSIEVWQNTGNTDFPFERTYFIEVGCAAAGTPVVIDNSVMWVGRNADGIGTVYMARSYQPQRISTHALELAIAGYGDISGATAWAYQDKGHTFYVLDFPNANTTWVYDISTGLWHERSFTNSVTGQETRQRAQYHVYIGSRHFVGDYENSSLYEMSDSMYVDEQGSISSPTRAPISFLRRYPHFSQNGTRIFYNALLMDIESGVGLDGATTTQGSDPLMMLRFSKDYGHTWGNVLTSSMGKLGEYNRRVKFNRLGSDRGRVFEAKSTEPVKQVWISTFLDIEVGSN